MLKAAAGAALLTPFGLTVGAQAQPGAMDSMKVAVLAGGDFATMTSELAVRKSRTGSIRTFARLEIDEQEAVARAFGGRPGATGLTARHRQMLDELSALNGSQFDAMYVRGQLMGHEELLRANRSYARSGTDPVARGASLVGIPAIMTHMAMLRAISVA
jgi:putative membrane protein